MDKLLSFVLRFRAFFVFLVLQAICFQLILQKNNYQKTMFINSSNGVAGNFYKQINDFESFVDLSEINDSLIQQNAELLERIKNLESNYMDSFHIISDSNSTPIYRVKSSRILKKTTNQSDNFFLLDKGMKDGITPMMGVSSPNGIIGIVKNVSYNYSTVRSILNTKHEVAAELKKNNHIGSITWNGKNHRFIQLNKISDYVNVHKGDTIVTSGNSAIFPANEIIGTVHSFSKNIATGFYEIEVELSVDMKEVRFAYVIENLAIKEIKDLELDNE